MDREQAEEVRNVLDEHMETRFDEDVEKALEEIFQRCISEDSDEKRKEDITYADLKEALEEEKGDEL